MPPLRRDIELGRFSASGTTEEDVRRRTHRAGGIGGHNAEGVQKGQVSESMVPGAEYFHGVVVCPAGMFRQKKNTQTATQAET